MPVSAFEIMGAVGSFIMSFSLFTQLWKVFRTKRADDISLTFQVLYVMGVALILVYGVGENLWPIYIPTSAELLAAILLLAMKLYYDDRNDQRIVEHITSTLEDDSKDEMN